MPKNGCKVFTTFSCGGGSSMGYKLAGYEVLGNCEIDPAINAMYVKNHHPKYNFLMGVQDFYKEENRKNIPEELYNLDILDGSPPCFVAGTKVKTARGYVNIEDVKVGDVVLTTNQTVDGVVTDVMKHELWQQTLRSINGSKPFVTESHPFMTTEWWKSMNPELSKSVISEDVSLLEIGDVLVTENGYEVVKSLVWMSAPVDTPIYNITVSGDHVYYADGYLVHNKEQPKESETRPYIE